MKYFEVIMGAPLFSGISETELKAMLSCLSATTGEYTKNQFILHSGEKIQSVGLVLSGSVHMINEDFWGNRNILAQVILGELFGETSACAAGEKLSVSAIALEATTVLFLNVRRILEVCSSACTFHTLLIRNLLSVLAEKNLQINNKLTHMAQRTTREKLLSYLSLESLRYGSASFTIPFNRQQLADYLSVDRSAMSNELCKMRNQGLLSFEKNRFTLKQGP